MIHEPVALAALAALLAVGSAWDLRCRTVPNALTVGIGLSGIAVQLADGGPVRVLDSVTAGAVVFGAFYVLWRKGALGGGDVKLGAATATWLGVEPLGIWAIASCLAAGILAIVCYACSARAARAEMRANLAHSALGLGVRAVAAVPGRVRVPAGLALSMGTVVAVLLAR